MKNSGSQKEAVLKAIKSGLPRTKSVESATESFINSVPAPSPQRIGSDEVQHNFQKMLELVGGECYITSGEPDLLIKLEEILRSFNTSVLLMPPDSEIRSLDVDSVIFKTSLRVIPPTQQNMAEAALVQAGLTSAFAGIADTGTVVLVHTKETGRLSALLPEVHIVLLKKSAVFPDKLTFIQHMKAAGVDLGATPMTWVTGPSSTADIEKVLVRGAHGPKRLLTLLY